MTSHWMAGNCVEAQVGDIPNFIADHGRDFAISMTAKEK